MDKLLSEVRMLFGSGPAPSATTLVVWNGFDQLEKACAVRFYSGKTWEDVLAENRMGAAHKLEEWSMLNASSLAYYGRAHLEYLFETVEGIDPDDEFVSQLFHQLYQLVYMHNGSPFTDTQTDVLMRIAQTLPIIAAERGKESLIDEYVVYNIELYLRELERGS